MRLTELSPRFLFHGGDHVLDAAGNLIPRREKSPPIGGLSPYFYIHYP
jgi:hypothetical protein